MQIPQLGKFKFNLKWAGFKINTEIFKYLLSKYLLDRRKGFTIGIVSGSFSSEFHLFFEQTC